MKSFLECTIGYRLRLWRTKRQMTVFNLADKVGIDDSAISKLEMCDINLAILARICKVLNVTLEELLSDAASSKQLSELDKFILLARRMTLEDLSLITKFMERLKPSMNEDVRVRA